MIFHFFGLDDQKSEQVGRAEILEIISDKNILSHSSRITRREAHH